MIPRYSGIITCVPFNTPRPFCQVDNVLVDLSYDMAGNWCERLPVVWQVPFQLSPFEPTSFGSLPEILGWIQEVSQPQQRKNR